MLSASRRARCSPRREISGAMALRRLVVSRNCCSRRPMAERSPRWRSSSPASSARTPACSSTMVAAWPSSFSNSARCVSSACSLSARRRSFSATAVRLRSRWSADFSASRRRRSSSRRATLSARIGARQIVAQLAHLVIQRDAILLARLLQGAQALQLGLEADDLLRQPVQARQHFVERRLARPSTSPPVRALRASWPADRRPLFLPPVTVWP